MKKSAGLLLYRQRNHAVEVLLVHPGGPFWKNKDEGAWSIPKGELNENEDPLSAAQREFAEETGIKVSGTFIPLEPVKQKSGKLVLAWALHTSIDESRIKSNVFDLEWPPRSGIFISVPEVDRGAWFTTETALKKILPAQAGLIHQLLHHLNTPNG